MTTDPYQSATPTRAKRRGAASHQGAAEHSPEHTPNLFDPVAPDSPIDSGQARRDEGQAAALGAADMRWTNFARRGLEELAAEGRPFTAEDLRERVGRPLASSDNVMGSLFGHASKEGLIVAVGYQTATRKEAAGRVLRVWQGVGS